MGEVTETLVGQVVDRKYQVEGLLGRGGMGAVFRAVHLGTSRTVALKVIAPHFASQPEFLQRFQREAHACGRLRHPNIVDVTDFGVADHESGKLAYLVMEYLDGCSLAEVLRQEGRLPLSWSIDVLDQVSSAVEEAHRHGILHRDLKPDNIWLEPNRRGGYTVKVLDFGLAKLGATTRPGFPAASQGWPAEPLGEGDRVRADVASVVNGTGSDAPTLVRLPPALAETDATLAHPPQGGSSASLTRPDDGATQAGSIVGTPAYMSPEQIRGDVLTPRSDVYSLGIIAYLMITGRPPFVGKSNDVLKSHLLEDPRPIRELRADLPQDAASLVMSALSKDPAARPSGASAFAGMLAARFETPALFLHGALQAFLAHFGAWLRLSILCFLPLLLVSLAFSLAILLHTSGRIDLPWLTHRSAGGPLFLALLTLAMAGMFALGGAVVPVAMQAVAAPLRPIEIGFLLKTFGPRFKEWALAMLPVLAGLLGLLAMSILSTAALKEAAPLLAPYRQILKPWRVPIALSLFALLLGVPLGIGYFIVRRFGGTKAFQFLGAVMLVEGLTGRRALQRSAELHDKAGNAMHPFQVATLAASGLMGAVIGVSVGLSERFMGPGIGLGWIAPFIAILFVLAGSFLSLVGALTYMRARRASGEPLDQALADFERSVLPPSHWQVAQRDQVRRQIELTR